MSTHAKNVSIVMIGKKLIVKKGQFLLLTPLMLTVQSQKEDIRATLLSMKGKSSAVNLFILILPLLFYYMENDINPLYCVCFICL